MDASDGRYELTVYRITIVVVCLLCGVKAQGCQDPPRIGNGYIVSASPYNDGDVVVYTCQEGYNMEGQADAVKCTSGAWDGVRPICTTNESKSLSIQMWVLIAIGIALGILLLIGLILLCVYCCCKRQSAYVGPGGFFGSYNVKQPRKTPVTVIKPEKRRLQQSNKPAFTKNTTAFSVDDALVRNEMVSRAVERVKEKAKNKAEHPVAASDDKQKKGDAFFIPVYETNTKPRRSPGVTPRPSIRSDTPYDSGYHSPKRYSPVSYHRGDGRMTMHELVRERQKAPSPKPIWLPHTHGVRNINTITK